MLRVSRMADYGTVVMTALARDPRRIHSAAEIADATGVSSPTVSKVLKTLAKDGLLASTRGINGGYHLACPPSQISVAQIIDAMDGPFGMTECSTHPGACVQESGCQVRSNWQRINRIIRTTLEQVTLDEMLRPIAPVAHPLIRMPR
ncbi:MAG TPA: SUF system Fe-S cluster assembly regulator [Casimicrobiaceae bacterium]